MILLQLETVKKILIQTVLTQILSLHCAQTMVVKTMQSHFMFVQVYQVYTPYLGIKKSSGFILARKKTITKLNHFDDMTTMA